jgi:hypothetical protein
VLRSRKRRAERARCAVRCATLGADERHFLVWFRHS